MRRFCALEIGLLPFTREPLERGDIHRFGQGRPK
jgi:hypothetical protein